MNVKIKRVNNIKDESIEQDDLVKGSVCLVDKSKDYEIVINYKG